jgi:hypothetical protein
VSDSDEGEWIAVHHSENEEEHEDWPDTVHDGNNEATARRLANGEIEDSGA